MVGSLNSNYNLKSYNYAKTGISPVSFRATENTSPNDTFETNNPTKKKKRSLLARIGIGVAIGTTALLGIMTLVSRGQTKFLTKLYKEKMVFKELPEKINFKEAKTLDEAIKFSKEVLGIEKIDNKISLEALNYANKGIVDVSNANKGKLFIPKEIIYNKSDKNWIAGVQNDIKSEYFGSLSLNEKYFSNEFLDKSLKSLLYKDGRKIYTDPKVCVAFTKGDCNAYFQPNNEFYSNVQKFYKSPNELSVNQKRELFWGMNKAQNYIEVNSKYTPDKLYNIAIKQNGSQKYSLKEFEKFDLEKQKQILKEVLDKKPIYINMKPENRLKTIHHEMGHLQDFAKNLKELDLKGWDFDIIKIIKESFKDAKEQVEKGIRRENNNGAIRYVENRWGGSTYEGYKNLLEKEPEKFKKYYPDLYEHLTNNDVQNIAGQVSGYAKTSIGEFIAEVYAGFIGGEKYSNDVINLYKKYGGPLLPGM